MGVLFKQSWFPYFLGTAKADKKSVFLAEIFFVRDGGTLQKLSQGPWFASQCGEQRTMALVGDLFDFKTVVICFPNKNSSLSHIF